MMIIITIIDDVFRHYDNQLDGRLSLDESSGFFDWPFSTFSVYF